MDSSAGDEVSPAVGVKLPDVATPLGATLLAGGIAGVLAKTAVAPLDRVKLLRQGGAAPSGVSAVQMLLDIYRREGRAGLLRGNGANALRVFPSRAIHFGSYERYLRWLAGAAPSLEGQAPVHHLLASSAASVTSLLATYPLDLARTRLACAGVAGAPPAPGIAGVLWGAYSVGGVRGVYRGMCPSLVRVPPASGITFYVYESLKLELPEERKGCVIATTACGMVAGLAGNTATYPVDVVRRQMQLGSRAVTGTFQGIVAIARAHGVRQLFAGMGLNYAKAAPSAAISLVAYEQLKALLNLPER